MKSFWERLDLVADVMVVIIAIIKWFKDHEVHDVVKQEPHRFLNGLLGCFVGCLVLVVCAILCITSTLITGGVGIAFLSTRSNDSVQAPSVTSSDQASSPLGQTLQSWGYVINLDGACLLQEDHLGAKGELISIKVLRTNKGDCVLTVRSAKAQVLAIPAGRTDTVVISANTRTPIESAVFPKPP